MEDKKDKKIDDLEIQLLVDGEISGQDKKALVERIYRSPEAMDRLEELMYQKFLLREWAGRMT